MKLPNHIQTNILLQNNTPLDEFLNLSPTQIHDLLYDTFGNNSPVQFRHVIDEKTLDAIPLFRIVEDYLKIIQRDQQIKLTPLGALPKKVMVELYDKGFLPDDLIENGIVKLWREEDCISIRSARLTAELAGLVRKVAGKLTLTKSATKLLDTNNRSQIFKMFFRAFTEKFSWSYNDGYPEQPIGQLGWAFSVIMIDKYGDQPTTVDFYAGKFLKTFPYLITFFDADYSTPEKRFCRCYGVRVFERFFLWFGFIKPEKKKRFLDTGNDTVTRTDLVKSIFNIDDR